MLHSEATGSMSIIALLHALSKDIPLLRLSQSTDCARIGIAETYLLSALEILCCKIVEPSFSIDHLKIESGAKTFRKLVFSAHEITLEFKSEDLVVSKIIIEPYFKTGPEKWLSNNSHNKEARALYSDILETPGLHSLSDILGGPSMVEWADKQPIDVIYTWINYEDPAWASLYNIYKNNPTSVINTDARSLSRGYSSNKLLYSMRSVTQNLSWARNIYVFTDCEPPGWLDINHPRIHWIQHEDVIPDKYLPTFSSHVIESFLHCIPGLSEQFLYLNNDIFVGQPLGKEVFFRGGKSSMSYMDDYGMVSGPVTEGAPDYLNASRNSAMLICNTFGFYPTRLHKHTAYALRKDIMREMENRWPQIYDVLRKSRFRTQNDLNITSFFYHYYGVATERVEFAELESVFVSFTNLTWKRQLRNLEAGNAAIFCVNEGGLNKLTGGWHKEVEKVLGNLFPQSAPWEKLKTLLQEDTKLSLTLGQAEAMPTLKTAPKAHDEIILQTSQNAANPNIVLEDSEAQEDIDPMTVAKQSLLYELASIQASQSMRVGRLLSEGRGSFKSFFRIIIMLFKDRKTAHKIPITNTQKLIRGLKMPCEDRENQSKSVKPAEHNLKKSDWQYDETQMWLDCDISGGGSVELHLTADDITPERLKDTHVMGVLQLTRDRKEQIIQQIPIKNINDAGDVVCLFILPKYCRSLRLLLEKPIEARSDSLTTKVYTFQRGLSVVVPACKARKHLPSLLKNLSEFCCKHHNRECIIVLNGPDDDSFQYLEKYQKQFNPSWLNVYWIKQASVGCARNLGLSKACYDHVTFVDDDDLLSHDFAIDITELMDGKNIVVTSLHNTVNNMTFENPISYQVETYQGQKNICCSSLPAIYAMNACKIAPAYLLRLSAFDEDMKRNEDVLFWSRIASIYRPLNTITAQNSPSIYLRQLSVDSLSRQYSSFNAQVVDRIATIRRLVILLNDKRCHDKAFVHHRINEQFHNLEIFWKRYPKHAQYTEKFCMECGLDTDKIFKKS